MPRLIFGKLPDLVRGGVIDTEIVTTANSLEGKDEKEKERLTKDDC